MRYREATHEYDFVPMTTPYYIFDSVRRYWHKLTAKSRCVDLEVNVINGLPPEQQYIDSRKWKYNIIISFKRLLPAISPHHYTELNRLMYMTYGSSVLFGVHFYDIRTDDPAQFNIPELVQAICDCYDFTINDLKITVEGDVHQTVHCTTQSSTY